MANGYARLMNIKGELQNFTDSSYQKFINMTRISARKSVIVETSPINVNFSM